MRTETYRRKFPLPGLLLAALAALLPKPIRSEDSLAASGPGQEAKRTWRQAALLELAAGLEGKPGAPFSLPAYLRIYTPRGTLQGMGSFHALGTERDGRPRISYAELVGKRYLPGDTDSLRVWDLVGIPKGRNWAFIMARGPVSAFAFNPARGVERITFTPPDSQGWLEERNWNGMDVLLLLFPTPGIFSPVERAEQEASQGDYVMAVRLLNLALREDSEEASGGKYLGFLEKAERLCRKGKPGEGEAWLDRAAEVDSSYSRLHYSIGRCRESQGDGRAALAAYRRALAYAGLHAGFAALVERRIRNLEKSFQENAKDGAKVGPNAGAEEAVEEDGAMEE